MADHNDEKLEQRLAALEGGNDSKKPTAGRALAALGGTAAILAAGAAFFYSQTYNQNNEAPLETAAVEEFQQDGSIFGDVVTDFSSRATEVDNSAELAAQTAAYEKRLKEMQAEIDRQAALREADRKNPPVNVDEIQKLHELELELQKIKAEADKKAALAALNLKNTMDALLATENELEIARLNANNPLPQDNSIAEQAQRDAYEKARLERLAEEQARINSDMIVVGSSSNGGSAKQSDVERRKLSADEAFVRDVASAAPVEQAQIIANPSNTVLQGSVIQAALETALNSSLPGQIHAVVTQDVHSYAGDRILIPRGSKLIGKYDSNIELAEKRILIAWERVILPDNQTVNISSYGGDALGRSGTGGFVDKRFGARFGSAALISLLAATPSIAASEIDSVSAGEVAENVSEDLRNATNSTISEYLSLPPVIHVDQGARITVMVDRDLEIF